MAPSDRPVRVRIAPSPTGNCHVGTARSALYNLLFARQRGGAFVLRIDDTDQRRSTEDSERGILEGLAWLGLSWDEGPDVGGAFGPYRQSERLDLYRSHADRLLESGRAYRCFCTHSELEAERAAALARGEPPRYSGRCRHLSESTVRERSRAGRTHVIRLRIEPKPMVLHDLVQGRVEQHAALLGDPVIVKSDGMPTYHFATVVDESAMAITHVLRGAEHLNNTFPQLQMAEALGFAPPAYGHFGLLLNRDRSKISKRTGAVYVGEFRKMGYLPEAMLNGLALSGWNPGTDRELLSYDDMLALFSLERCSGANAIFDRDKLLWLNGVHLRSLPLSELARRVEPFLAVEADGGPSLATAAGLVQERMKTLDEAAELLGYFYCDPDPETVLALLAADRFTGRRSLAELCGALAGVRDSLESIPADSWGSATLASGLDAHGAALGWKRGELFMAIRIAVSGAQATPSLFETLAVVGREATLRRLAAAAARMGEPVLTPAGRALS